MEHETPQLAGIAINYDSPQAEAPNCILLGVPTDDGMKIRTERRAVETVIETLAWMKIRALSSHDRVMPMAQFPGANVLSPTRDEGRERLPTAILFDQFAPVAAGGLEIAIFSLTAFARMERFKASALVKRCGYTRKRE